MTAAARPAPALDAPDPALLCATTVAVHPATWPARLGAAADDGWLVAGRTRVLAGIGTAATLPLPHGLCDPAALSAVRDWLAAVDHRGSGPDDPDAPKVMAVGAFPFDRTAPATLCVPSSTWCRSRDGRVWRVDVSRRDGARRGPHPDGRARAARTSPDVTPGPPSLTEVPAPEHYAAAVGRALADIASGRLAKVVLGRMVELRLGAAAVPSQVLRALWGDDPAFAPFSLPTPTGRLVGASPELVVGRSGARVVSHAFAGTTALSGTDAAADVAAARLADSGKDRTEHRLVVDEIARALGTRCGALIVPDAPSVVRLRSDARLGTLIEGTLPRAAAGAGRGGTALELLALLHPTPAVGGVPRAIALERITALEAAPRGYWAGTVGWTDAAGDGEWVLAIRSAVLGGSTAQVRAGAGIVDGSQPLAELAETTVKLRPVLEALWPGSSALL